jgi:hypothetical protein
MSLGIGRFARGPPPKPSSNGGGDGGTSGAPSTSAVSSPPEASQNHHPTPAFGFGASFRGDDFGFGGGQDWLGGGGFGQSMEVRESWDRQLTAELLSNRG